MAVPSIRLQSSGRVVKLGRIRPLVTLDLGDYHIVVMPDRSYRFIAKLGNHYRPSANERAMPESTNWRAAAAKTVSEVYGNDQWGDCVIASKFHQLGSSSANDDTQPPAHEIIGTTDEAVAEYHRICGAGDNGCIIADVLDEMRQNGILMGGSKRKIDAYVSVDWRNADLVKAALLDLGPEGCLGVNLPQAWTSTNTTWDVPTGSGAQIVGGHDVHVIDYTAEGIVITTWGGLVTITWSALADTRFVEECYWSLGAQWYGADQRSPNGLDLASLKADLDSLGGGKIPPLPGPTPTPPPGPSPTPGDYPTYGVSLTGAAAGPFGLSIPVTLAGSASPNASGESPCPAAAVNVWQVVLDLFAVVAAIQTGDPASISAAVAKLLADLGVAETVRGFRRV